MSCDFSLDDISKNIMGLYSNQLKNVLSDISKTYGIKKETLFTKYLNMESLKTGKKRKKKVVKSENLCMARKQDGNQCTRRRKDDCEYCGKHIKNRRYGRVDDNSSIDKLADDDNYIMTWIENFEGIEYLVDSNNIVYTKNVDCPTIVGKKISEGVIQFIK